MKGENIVEEWRQKKKSVEKSALSEQGQQKFKELEEKVENVIEDLKQENMNLHEDLSSVEEEVERLEEENERLRNEIRELKLSKIGKIDALKAAVEEADVDEENVSPKNYSLDKQGWLQICRSLGLNLDEIIEK